MAEPATVPQALEEVARLREVQRRLNDWAQKASNPATPRVAVIAAERRLMELAQ